MHEDIKAVLITEEQIKQRVQEMGEQLSKEYEGKRVITAERGGLLCLRPEPGYVHTGSDGVYGSVFLRKQHVNLWQCGSPAGRGGRYCRHACPFGR